jgi:NADH-quinone oxidoreductase subunit F
MQTDRRQTDSEATVREVLAARANGQAMLLPLLLEIQDKIGFIPENSLPLIARSLGYSRAELLGVITYHRHLRLLPLAPSSSPGPAPRTLRVCRGISCHLAGSGELLADLSRRLRVPVGGTTPDGLLQLEECACLGLCHAAPAGALGEKPFAAASAQAIADAVKGNAAVSLRPPGEVKVGSAGPLLVDCAKAPILSLEDYVSHGGLSALRQALDMSPEQVIATIDQSGLRGRGGAGFPAALKWKAIRSETETPKYVICNADESEPGTFKDRFLLARNPFAVLEGMAIAAYAIGAEEAYLFFRYEYKDEFDLLSRCIEEATRSGFLGDNTPRSSFPLRIHPFRNAGGYICGEETALIEAIEGNRGEPRLRPPYPTVRGLWGRPTLINNVETLANVPLILRDGPQPAVRRVASLGTDSSKGTRLFCLSGDVAAPGLYEAPLGIPLRQMLEMAGAKQTKAVLLGGAAGQILPLSQADAPLDFEHGAGNGAIIVLDESRCLVDVSLNLMEFFARECCGLCLVGREGTSWALSILRQAAIGQGSRDSLEALKDVLQTLSLASRCGLGQTAPNAILGIIRHFPEEVEAHFPCPEFISGVGRTCPLGVCGREE